MVAAYVTSCQEALAGEEVTGMKSCDFIPLNPNQHINMFFLSPCSALLTLASLNLFLTFPASSLQRHPHQHLSLVPYFFHPAV